MGTWGRIACVALASGFVLIGAASPGRADPEERELISLIRAYTQHIPPASITISVARSGDPASVGADGCPLPNYQLIAAGEAPPAGYMRWIGLANENHLVHYETSPGGGPTESRRCIAVIERALLTDPRLLWTEDHRLSITLAYLSFSNLAGHPFSETTGGVSDVSGYEVTFDLIGKSEWKGVTLAPNKRKTVMRIVRDPTTKKLRVAVASFAFPTVRLEAKAP